MIVIRQGAARIPVAQDISQVNSPSEPVSRGGIVWILVDKTIGNFEGAIQRCHCLLGPVEADCVIEGQNMALLNESKNKIHNSPLVSAPVPGRIQYSYGLLHGLESLVEITPQAKDVCRDI